MNSLPTKCKKTTVFPYSILASDIFSCLDFLRRLENLSYLERSHPAGPQGCNSAVSKTSDGAGNTPALSLR